MTVKKIKITVNELTCDRCGQVWQIPTDRPLPKVCYRCKSLNWNGQPRPQRKEGEK